MNLLLDTHIWIWSLLDPDKLSVPVRKALEAPDNQIWLSPISTWEFLMLVEKGRVVLDLPANEWLVEAAARAPTREAPLTHEIACESRVLVLSHEDPADRFLAATAKVLNLTLVTADSRLTCTTEFAILAN